MSNSTSGVNRWTFREDAEIRLRFDPQSGSLHVEYAGRSSDPEPAPEPPISREQVHLDPDTDPMDAFIGGFKNGWHARALAGAVPALQAIEGAPRTCFCGKAALWPDGKCDRHHAARGLGAGATGEGEEDDELSYPPMRLDNFEK